jgi:hypothetical protein
MVMIYEKSIYAFFFVTVIAGGGAAFMIGRASAMGWKPFWRVLFYVLILSAALRFLHWGLFAGATLESWRQAQGSLFSAHYFLVDSTFLLLFAVLGFQLQRRRQMRRQYGWLMKKTSLFS